MVTKNEKAAQARAAAQKQVSAKERRSTVIIVAVSAVVLVVFAGIVFFIVNSSKVPDVSEAHAPAPADASGGVPVGTTGVAGEDVPTDANRVDLYIDLMCPICHDFEATNAADLDALREDGSIAIYYHAISFLDEKSQGTRYSSRAANAVAVVADKDPSHYLQFITALYANQPQEYSTGLDNDQIEAIAVGVGVPAKVAATFKDEEFAKFVIASTDQAAIDGRISTPGVRINGEVLEQTDVNYMQPGNLKAYLEALPAP